MILTSYREPGKLVVPETVVACVDRVVRACSSYREPACRCKDFEKLEKHIHEMRTREPEVIAGGGINISNLHMRGVTSFGVKPLEEVWGIADVVMR